MKKLLLSTCLIVAATGAHAQSKIQCVLSADGSTYQAAQIWQNTLGAQRANMICQQQTSNPSIERHAQARPAGNTTAPAGRFSHDQYAKAMSMASPRTETAKSAQWAPPSRDANVPAAIEIPTGYEPMW